MSLNLSYCIDVGSSSLGSIELIWRIDVLTKLVLSFIENETLLCWSTDKSLKLSILRIFSPSKSSLTEANLVTVYRMTGEITSENPILFLFGGDISTLRYLFSRNLSVYF